MSQRRLAALLAVVAAAVVAAPGFAEDKVALRWKFEDGKSFYQKMNTKTKQSMNVLNNNVKQDQEQTFYFEWKTVLKDKDKHIWEITQTIQGVEMNIDLGGTKIVYNSTKADTPQNNALADFFKALVGSKFTLTVEVPDNGPVKITKIDGRDDFLKKLVQTNQQMKPLLEQILSEKALMEMAAPTFNALPDADKAPKDKWDASSTLDMGPIGKYNNKFNYTYEGKNSDAKEDKDKKLDKISVTTELTYTPPDTNVAAGGLPFKIKSADLKSKDAKGEILVDTDKGRPVKTTMHLALSGKLSIEIGGQTTEVTLDQTQDTTVDTSDESLLPKK
jgi:Family of unknown function (DUF6263)